MTELNSKYQFTCSQLHDDPKTWLITGVAGFIGSHLLHRLLELDQTVVGLDNFFTGRKENLEDVRSLVSPAQWSRFRFIEGDVRNQVDCKRACLGANFVLHHAALASVPLSVEDPILTDSINSAGFVNVLTAARENRVQRVIYASSAAVYGDGPGLPKEEKMPTAPLSPYAATKCVNEVYADTFHRAYGLNSIGLRYFNVFGWRQDPRNQYAGVIAKWIQSILLGQPIHINGDGEITRDFCHIGEIIQANILSAMTETPDAPNHVYNVALGKSTSLNELAAQMIKASGTVFPDKSSPDIIHRPPRVGDILHSRADIQLAQQRLGFAPSMNMEEGLEETLQWFKKRLGNGA